MIFNIKTKWRWPFSLIFRPKESQYEILPELPPNEKRLERELKLNALKSAIKADREADLFFGKIPYKTKKIKASDAARSIRGENEINSNKFNNHTGIC